MVIPVTILFIQLDALEKASVGGNQLSCNTAGAGFEPAGPFGPFSLAPRRFRPLTQPA